MSKKGNDTPSSIRIRENQRRSRNQRKELIQDLQRRVQEYELNGIVATQDMQRAARRVAEENARLRNLLASRGVSQEEVNLYLQSFDKDSHPHQFVGAVDGSTTQEHAMMAQRMTRVTRRAVPPHVPPQPTIPTGIEAPAALIQNDVEVVTVQRPYEQQDAPSNCESRLPTSTQDREESHDGSATHDNDAYASPITQVADVECPNASDCFCPPSTANPDRSLDTGLLISCETAATIIAEMRGDGDGDRDRHRIRASLGCYGREDCSVKNSIVLELMDDR